MNGPLLELLWRGVPVAAEGTAEVLGILVPKGGGDVLVGVFLPAFQHVRRLLHAGLKQVVLEGFSHRFLEEAGEVALADGKLSRYRLQGAGSRLAVDESDGLGNQRVVHRGSCFLAGFCRCSIQFCPDFLHGRRDIVERGRFDQIVFDSKTKCLLGIRELAIGAHDAEEGVLPLVFQCLDQVKTRLEGHADIGEDHVDRVFQTECDGRTAIAKGSCYYESMCLPGKAGGEPLAEFLLVVDDDQLIHGSDYTSSFQSKTWELGQEKILFCMKSVVVLP